MNYILSVPSNILFEFSFTKYCGWVKIENCWQKPFKDGEMFLFFPVLTKEQAEELAQKYHVSEQ